MAPARKVIVRFLNRQSGDKEVKLTAKELKAVIRDGELVVNDDTKQVINNDDLIEKINSGEAKNLTVIPPVTGG